MVILPGCPCCGVPTCECICAGPASYFTNVALAEPLVCGSVTYGVDDVLYTGNVVTGSAIPPGLVNQTAVAQLPERYCTYVVWLDRATHFAHCSITCAEARGYVATSGIFRAFARVCSPSPAWENISAAILDQSKVQFTQLELSCRPEELSGFTKTCLASAPACTQFTYYDPWSPSLSCA